MKVQNAPILALTLLLSCGNAPISERAVSNLGFYSPPEAVIAALESDARGYQEHFVLALAYKKQKRYKEAILHFANSCFKSQRDPRLRLFPQPVYQFMKGFHIKSDYYDDAAYEIADLFSLYAEHAYVVRFVDLMSGGTGALYRDAQLLKAKSLGALSRYDEAISTLDSLLADYDDPDSRSIMFLRKGSLLEKKPDLDDAVKSYIGVLAVGTSGWQAATAARRILQIMENPPLTLDAKQNALYAQGLFFAGEYQESIALLGKLKTADPDNPEINAFLVRALTRNNETAAADALIRTRAGVASFRAALIKAQADELWRMNRKANAVPLYREVVKSASEPLAQESLRLVAKYMEEGKHAGYDQLLTDYKNRYADDDAGYFLWLLARNILRAKDYARALPLLEESVSGYPVGSHSDECRFWLHKIYAQAGNTEQALKTARDMIVINPDSAYTWLLMKQLAAGYDDQKLKDDYQTALRQDDAPAALFSHALIFLKEKSLLNRSGRIGDLNSPSIAQYRSLDKKIAGMKTSSGYTGILKGLNKYFAVGHTAAITRELGLIPETDTARKDKYIALAHYSQLYDHAYLGTYALLELLKLSGLKENITLMPEGLVHLLFPAPFADCAARYGSEYAVDTNVIYALIKAESLFRHNAVSSAGAMGLMQLMPATARGLARQMKMGNYDLTDPCTSIRLGAKYISGLSREFGGNFQYMVAAYNAGGGNVKKWKDKLQGDMDYFTEFTPFIETRYYILRTDKFLTQYGLIYPGGKPSR
jgi:soluble lytic murein transglycosylase-like protein